MLRRMTLAVAALALAVAGCGGDSAADTTAAAGDGGTTTTAAAPAVTTTTAAATATSAPATTTTEPATTTTAEPTTTTAAAVVPAGGLPDTFLAINDDYAAVAVDTQTGEVIHFYGQLANAADVAAAEEMSPNVLVGIWRVLDGSMVALSDCCEPAAGNIFYLPVDGELSESPYADGNSAYGWTLSPSPTQNMFAIVGYNMIVEDPSVTADTGPGQPIDDPDLGFPSGAPGWDRDGSQVYWTTVKDGATGLAMLDLAEGSPVFVAELPWVGENQSLSGIGSQASGNLVGFLTTYDSSHAVAATEGVVFTVAGDLVATFTVETGSTWGGYDATGTRLIYVDGDGVVRWQGGGQSGELADGYLFASW